MATKEKRVKISVADNLQDIDLDVDPTDTAEGKERLNSLVSTVNSLFKVDDKKKISKRSEPSTVFGELGLATNKQDKIEIHHLLNSVVDKTGKIKKQIRKITHKKLLPLPINTKEAKKIERKVLYDETVKDVSKWEPVVKKNREANQLSFPLEKPKVNVETAQDKFNLKISNPLKAEVDSLLQTSEHVIKKEKALTKAEEKYLKQMSIEEARIRHAELQKRKALISYQEAKLKRKARIKSRKYHKMLKKEKLKKEMKEFEELKKKNPDAALEKLMQLDKMRALERASLKHRNSGKWAKQNLLRAKYDPKAREDMKEQLHLNAALMQKAIFDEEEDDVDDDIDPMTGEDLGEGEVMMASDGYGDTKPEPNPWLMRSSNTQTPLLSSDDIIAENETAADEDEPEKEISPAEEIELVKQAIQTKRTKTIEESRLEVKPEAKSETKKVAVKEKKIEEKKEKGTKKTKVKAKKKEEDEEEEEINDNLMIDPKKILTTKTHELQTGIPDYQEMGIEDDSDEDDALMSDDDGQRKLIAEAFDEDDVVAEFIQDKKEQIDKEEGKDIDTFLPGWGSWTGPGLRENKRNRKKFILKAERRKRRDAKLHNVIISENKDKVISKFMVKELPFNCKSVPDFESKYKKPIGPNWNPETQFRYNVEPKVFTQLGKIIDPINEKALLKPGNKRRPLDQVAKTLADVIPV